MAKKSDIFAQKLSNIFVVFVIISFVLIEGVFLFKFYQINFFIFSFFNLLIFISGIGWYHRIHELSISSLNEAIDLLAKSPTMKVLRLHGVDEESRKLARHINKIILSAKKTKKSVYDLLANKGKEYQDLERRNEEIRYHLQELQIFGDIADRIAYSQNIPAIVEVIAGSIGKLLSYTSVSYVLLDEEVLNFHIRLEEGVSRSYIEEIKQKMIDSLVGLTNSEKIRKIPTEDIIIGSAIDDTKRLQIGSFFNGPIVIGDKIVGLLNVTAIQVGHFTERQMGVLFAITKKVSSAAESLRQILEEEKGKLNAMVTSISDGLLVVDNHLMVMVANPALKIMLDLAIPEVGIFDVMNKLQNLLDIRSKLQEAIKLDKLIEEKEFLFGELYLRPIFSPLRSKSGDKIGAVMLLQDITKEHELQRLRQDFTSMMVHELRSPLDGVKKISELMKDENVVTDKKAFQEYLQMIHTSSSNMLELVNDLLDAAKLEAGKFEIHKSLTNVRDLIKERVDFFDILAKDAKINLNFIIDKEVPEKISFDQLRIGQVLNNLLSNALKFTAAGGKVVVQVFLHHHNQNIEAETKAAGIECLLKATTANLKDLPDSVIFAVTDSGAGIAQENLGQLFNKFKQFKIAMTSVKKGTGLGLAISKGIVDVHKGMIGVESVESVGSTFYFTLPLV